MKLTTLMIGVVLLGCSQEQGRAWRIIERTQSPRATYAAYGFVAARNTSGKPDLFWAADFNAGDWHRLEGASFRKVANCRTKIGYAYDSDSNRVVDSASAYLEVCGIFTGRKIASAEILPSMKSKYGKLEVVKIIDDRFTRYYAVDSRGIIIRGNWVSDDEACNQAETVVVTDSLPSGEIFNRSSLLRSVVPPSYKVLPATWPKLALSGRACIADK